MLIKTEIVSTTEPVAAAATVTSGSAIFCFCTFMSYGCIEVLLHAFNKSLFFSRRIKFALLVDSVFGEAWYNN